MNKAICLIVLCKIYFNINSMEFNKEHDVSCQTNSPSTILEKKADLNSLSLSASQSSSFSFYKESEAYESKTNSNIIWIVDKDTTDLEVYERVKKINPFIAQETIAKHLEPIILRRIREVLAVSRNFHMNTSYLLKESIQELIENKKNEILNKKKSNMNLEKKLKESKEKIKVFAFTHVGTFVLITCFVGIGYTAFQC